MIGGGIGVGLLLFGRLLCESPRVAWHRLGCGAVLPPLWLLGCLYLAWGFLLGATAGYLIAGGGTASRRTAGGEAALWRGCTALCLTYMLTLGWYLLFFGKCSLLISLLCLVLTGAAAAAGAVSLGGLSLVGAVIPGGYVLWVVYLLFSQIAVIFGT